MSVHPDIRVATLDPVKDHVFRFHQVREWSVIIVDLCSLATIANGPLLFSVSRPPPRLDRSATKSARSRHHIPSASASSSVSQHGLDPLDKIAATKSPMTRTMAEVYLEHAQEAELRRKREERGLSFGRARMVASISASASGSNLFATRRGVSVIASQSQRDELPKYYIGPGAKLMSTEDEQSGSDEEHHAHPR